MAQNDELLQPWATGVWQDLDGPATVAVSTISGYAVQPNTLGRLNSLAGTCFSGSGYTGVGTTNYQIGPWVTNTELAIIGQMYLVSYYNNLVQATMGVGGTTIPWLAIAEGDSKIGRVNAASIGAQYREAAKDAYAQLWNLVNSYRTNSAGGSIPRSVDYLNLVGPTWGETYTWPT